jgi:hypothetical protein
MISPVISNDEDVARVLFYPSFFTEDDNPLISEGILSPTAFRLQVLKSGDAEKAISVLRTMVDSFSHDVAKLSPRQPTDFKYGYALLNVGDVRTINIPTTRKIDISVEYSNSKRLLSHSEILLRLDGNIVTAMDESMEVARFRKKLARIASTRIIRL